MQNASSKKSFFAKTILSTVFCAMPLVALGFEDLSTTGSSITPSSVGYNFVADNVTFTLNGQGGLGTSIGTDNGISIDNHNGFPGMPFKNDVFVINPTGYVNFNEAITVTGTVGTTNPIGTINVG